MKSSGMEADLSLERMSWRLCRGYWLCPGTGAWRRHLDVQVLDVGEVLGGALHEGQGLVLMEAHDHCLGQAWPRRWQSPAEANRPPYGPLYGGV